MESDCLMVLESAFGGDEMFGTRYDGYTTL